MQAFALLLPQGSYHWVRNLWVLITYLFFLLVMLPSVVPRLTIDSAVRVFPGVWKLLSLFFFFLKLLFFKTPFPGPSSVPTSFFFLSVPTSFVSLFIFYIFSYLL